MDSSSTADARTSRSRLCATRLGSRGRAAPTRSLSFRRPHLPSSSRPPNSSKPASWTVSTSVRLMETITQLQSPVSMPGSMSWWRNLWVYRSGRRGRSWKRLNAVARSCRWPRTPGADSASGRWPGCSTKTSSSARRECSSSNVCEVPSCRGNSPESRWRASPQTK